MKDYNNGFIYLKGSQYMYVYPKQVYILSFFEYCEEFSLDME